MDRGIEKKEGEDREGKVIEKRKEEEGQGETKE